MESIENIDKYVPDFSNILSNKLNINFNTYFLLLSEEDINSSANPFICCLISYYIKNNINVILVSSQESLHHYSSIGKKFGLNLNNNEKFCMIDLFYNPIKKLLGEELPLSENFPYTYNPNRSKAYYTNVGLTVNGDVDFAQLTEDISSHMQKMKSDNKYVIIFDNISLLPNDTETMTNDINSLVQFSASNDINFVLTINKELSEPIYNYLYNISDMEIEFKPNESGFSKDMDGQIKVNINSYNTRDWSLRYSIKENGINFFPHLVI